MEKVLEIRTWEAVWSVWAIEGWHVVDKLCMEYKNHIVRASGSEFRRGVRC